MAGLGSWEIKIVFSNDFGSFNLSSRLAFNKFNVNQELKNVSFLA